MWHNIKANFIYFSLAFGVVGIAGPSPVYSYNILAVNVRISPNYDMKGLDLSFVLVL
jgi:hypothetical protein